MILGEMKCQMTLTAPYEPGHMMIVRSKMTSARPRCVLSRQPISGSIQPSYHASAPHGNLPRPPNGVAPS